MSAELAELLGRFAPATLCDAHPAVRPMHPSIKPLFEGAVLCGRARTAAVRPGQNAAVHRALHVSRPGEVLVLAGADSEFGYLGDLLALASIRRGLAGAVIDGAVRDSAEIRALGFATFCRGVSPARTEKSDRGAIDVEVVCAGVVVRPGDVIVGGADGVVVVPFEIAPDVARRAQLVVGREESIRAGLHRGETSCEILGIEP